MLPFYFICKKKMKYIVKANTNYRKKNNVKKCRKGFINSNN